MNAYGYYEYVIANAPLGATFEFGGAKYYVHFHPSRLDETVVYKEGRNAWWDFIDPETAPEGLFAAWAKELEEVLPAARREALEMFHDFGLWPEGEWDIIVDDDGNYAGEVWVREHHSPYAWAIYEAERHQWMLDKAAEIASISDPAERRLAWQEFGVNITDRAHVSDGWIYQHRYDGDYVTFRGKAGVEGLRTRQTTSTGSLLTSYTVIAGSEDAIVFVWNCESGDPGDIYRLSVVDPEVLAVFD